MNKDDSALKCLLLLAHHYQVEADEERLRHEFDATGDGLDMVGLVLAAKSIGFKSERAEIDWRRLRMLPTPVICALAEGGYGVLASVNQKDGDEEKLLILHPGEKRPRAVSVAEAQATLTGSVILLASRASLTGEMARFDFTWFVPAIVKYRKQLYEVLIMSLFIQLFALATPIFFQVVMDKVLVHRGLSTLDVLVFGLVVITWFEVVMSGVRAYVFAHTTNRMDVELGSRLFKHLLALPQAYFDARRVGDSVARVRELENIRNFLTNSMVTVLLDFLFIFVFITAMFIYSKELTWLVLASLPLYVLVSLIISPLLRHRLKEKFARGAENQAFLVEMVNGVATVKAHAVEPRMSERWDNQLAAYVNASFKASNLANVGSHLVQLISKLVTAAILWFGARAVIQGELTVGQLIAFNMLAGRVSQPVIRMAQLWQDFQQVGVSVRRLGDILNTPREHSGGRRTTLPKLLGEVEFLNVDFYYPGQEKAALRGVNLKALAGQTVGVVGHSGSGKSTLTKLVQRLYVPSSGRVTVDGMELPLTDPLWLRRQIGVVLQENLLFNLTVHENIAITSKGMAMDRIIHVAKLAGAHEFIMELGEGYETVLGEHGSSLSGGQRQRIAIARAIASDPKVLIFDEATSALDYETESIIQANMREISHDRTTFIISHRLTALRDCDFIIVMEEGKVAECGTEAELLALSGIYARLFEQQRR